MQIRYRRGKPHDVSRAARLLEPDRPLFCPRTWELLPGMLEDLLRRERILLCLLEDADTGEVVFAGASGFLQPHFLKRAMDRGGGILEPAIIGEFEGRATFMNRRAVAEANRRQDLHLVNFFGVPEQADLSDTRALEQFFTMTDAWNFFHKGFSLGEIWYDTAVPVMADLMLRLGLRMQQERILPGGKTARVFLFSRNQAIETVPSWPGSAMFAPPPRFGFTHGEQQLLELALLDNSDRAAAAELQLSTESIKKRWRSIYAKIASMEPALLRSEVNGADRRRALLQSLRANLQELRPY